MSEHEQAALWGSWPTAIQEVGFQHVARKMEREFESYQRLGTATRTCTKLNLR